MFVDTVAARCLPVDPADRALFAATVPRPKGWPREGAKKRELQTHVDKLEAAIVARNEAGNRNLDERERCRRDDVPSTPNS